MKAPELCSLAIKWLRATYPGSVIVPEMSVADWGGARIDLAAITETEIVGIEIKGEGDSPSRLELQGHVYGRVARRMWLLADESIQDKCHGKRPKGWGRLEVWEGEIRPWNRATKLGNKIPVKGGGHRYEPMRDHGKYDPDAPAESPLLCPHSMCGTLWRDELYDIARVTGVQTVGKAYVHALTEAICEQLPAPVIHREMIGALRHRDWKKKVIDTRREPEPEPANRKAPNRPISETLI